MFFIRPEQTVKQTIAHYDVTVMKYQQPAKKEGRNPSKCGRGVLLSTVWAQPFTCTITAQLVQYEDAIKWKHFPRYWPFVREFIGPR